MEFGLYCLGMALSLDLSTTVVALLFAAQTSLLQTCSSEHLPPGFFLPSCQIQVSVLAEAGHLHRLLFHLVMCSLDTRCHVCNLFPSPGFCLECLLYPLLPTAGYQAHVLPDLPPLTPSSGNQEQSCGCGGAEDENERLREEEEQLGI